MRRKLIASEEIEKDYNKLLEEDNNKKMRSINNKIKKGNRMFLAGLTSILIGVGALGYSICQDYHLNNEPREGLRKLECLESSLDVYTPLATFDADVVNKQKNSVAIRKSELTKKISDNNFTFLGYMIFGSYAMALGLPLMGLGHYTEKIAKADYELLAQNKLLE